MMTSGISVQAADFSDVKINEMPDMACYHADLNDTIEKRQQKFIRKVGGY